MIYGCITYHSKAQGFKTTLDFSRPCGPPGGSSRCRWFALRCRCGSGLAWEAGGALCTAGRRRHVSVGVPQFTRPPPGLSLLTCCLVLRAPRVASVQQTSSDVRTALWLGSGSADGRLSGFPSRDTATLRRHSISPLRVKASTGARAGEEQCQRRCGPVLKLAAQGERQASDGRSSAVYVLARHPTGPPKCSR